MLYLHGNKLSGEIPRSLGDLKRLQKLVLINNRLTGERSLTNNRVLVMLQYFFGETFSTGRSSTQSHDTENLDGGQDSTGAAVVVAIFCQWSSVSQHGLCASQRGIIVCERTDADREESRNRCEMMS